MSEDRVEIAIQGAALAITLGLAVLFASRNVLAPPLPVEAPKPTQVRLSVVEEPPATPPPAIPPPPVPIPPPEPLPSPDLPPPPQATPSLLPPPPPPRPLRPRHVVRPRHPPPRTVQREVTPPLQQPPAERRQAETAQSQPSQAPENHSAESAYIGRLHAVVKGNTRPPDSAVFRLSHLSGEVVVAFTLSRGGAISNVRVARSSGSALIDQQGDLIVSGARYPAMPDDVYPGQSSHSFTATVRILPYVGVTGAGDL